MLKLNLNLQDFLRSELNFVEKYYKRRFLLGVHGLDLSIANIRPKNCLLRNLSK